MTSFFVQFQRQSTTMANTLEYSEKHGPFDAVTLDNDRMMVTRSNGSPVMFASIVSPYCGWIEYTDARDPGYNDQWEGFKVTVDR